MRNFNFSAEILYIVYGLLATQHARCHKEYYSPRGQAVSMNYFTHSLRSTCHSTCPLSQKNITLQEAEPSLRVILLSEKHQLCESFCGTSPSGKTFLKLATGGKPSTWFPPGGLVETAGTPTDAEPNQQCIS